jgi:hypothetical protein
MNSKATKEILNMVWDGFAIALGFAFAAFWVSVGLGLTIHLVKFAWSAF